MKEFIQNIPKAELHVHIEGTLEPELMFKLAAKNNIPLKYKNVEEVKAAYQFNNLQEFLDIYYLGANVLQTKDDFYELTFSYLKKLHEQNVVYAELMFDPQTHTSRGIELSVVVEGIKEAMAYAEKQWHLKTELIFSFLRHLSQCEAFKVWDEAEPYKNEFIAVGLDSSEVGNPPEKFLEVFKKVREDGVKAIAHAGEEGPAMYIRNAIDLLKISRIDHGNNCLQDPDLVDELVAKQIPLTLCPLSNLSLKVITNLKQHPLKYMMEKGLLVTINSDDPAYFGGQLVDNYKQTVEALGLDKQDIVQLAKNSFIGSFLSDSLKVNYINMVEQFVHNYTE